MADVQEQKHTKFNIAENDRNIDTKFLDWKLFWVKRKRSLGENGLTNEEPDSHELWMTSGGDRRKLHDMVFGWSSKACPINK